VTTTTETPRRGYSPAAAVLRIQLEDAGWEMTPEVEAEIEASCVRWQAAYERRRIAEEKRAAFWLEVGPGVTALEEARRQVQQEREAELWQLQSRLRTTGGTIPALTVGHIVVVLAAIALPDTWALALMGVTFVSFIASLVVVEVRCRRIWSRIRLLKGQR
jgi:hypothetical protein